VGREIFPGDPSRNGTRGREASPLTAKDREVLGWIADGQTLKEIAARTGRSVKTIEKRRRSILAKLGFAGDAQLVKYAVRKGLTTVA
jgi:two-component system capsular synthesis response regulator RcsB